MSIEGLTQLARGSKVTLRVIKPDGSQKETVVLHTMTPEEVAWFKAGSALNILKPK